MESGKNITQRKRMKRDTVLDFSIRKLEETDTIPYHLLLDADPSRQMVDSYLARSECYIELMNIAIAGPFQRKGIGKLLMEHAWQVAREMNYRELVLGTGNCAVDAIKFYLDLGFEIYDLWKDYITGHYEQPIIEFGIQCRHKIMFRKDLSRGRVQV